MDEPLGRVIAASRVTIRFVGSALFPCKATKCVLIDPAFVALQLDSLDLLCRCGCKIRSNWNCGMAFES